jgi:hypothetical protein
MAHHGKFTDDLNNVFNPDSEGYCYVKGKGLIGPIIDFHNNLGEEISYSNAAYRSHIIIEMALDLILHQEEGSTDLMDFFYEALKYTFDYKISEFSETMAWLFGINQETVSEATRQALDSCTSSIKESFMNCEDCAGLYIDKFCLNGEDEFTREGVVNLLNQGINLVPDYKSFLLATIASIKKTAFTNPLYGA